MNEEKLFRLLTEAGLVATGPLLTATDLRRNFGMRFEVAKKWENVFNRLPRRFDFDNQKAQSAAKRMREICLDFLNLYDAATDSYAKQAAIQQSYVNEQDAKDDKVINGTLSRMPEAPTEGDYNFDMRLTSEDLKNFIPTDGLS